MQARFTLGDTLTFSATLADYPASDGWVLHYRLIPRGDAGSAVAFNSTASGADHLVTVSAATTAAWQPGTYGWASWVTDGTSTHSIGQGATELLPNPRTAVTPLDMRSAAQIALDNVRAILRGKASADVLSYTIAGRSLQRYSVAELITLESKLANDVARENRETQMAAFGRDPSRLQVRLGRA